jgi:hypothetical protein
VGGYRAAFFAGAALMIVGTVLLAVMVSAREARVDQVSVPVTSGADG